MSRRVVITGIGLVTPLAIGTEETWQALLAGKSGIGPITHFDHTAFATHFAGEVKGFDPTRWMTSREAQDARPVHPVRDRRRRAGDGGLRPRRSRASSPSASAASSAPAWAASRRIEATCKTLCGEGAAPRHLAVLRPDDHHQPGPGQLSIRHGAKGPNMSHVSACSTGAHAIGEAFRVIPRGDADAMICGGTEATVTPLGRGRLQQHARAVDPQRRAAAGVAAVRPRSRRLRHRRGGGHRRARGAGARQGARREDLRRGDGLRGQRRRPPHHRARARRRGRPALHEAGARRREARRPRTSATSTPTAPRPR